jgi:hypothetical protein
MYGEKNSEILKTNDIFSYDSQLKNIYSVRGSHNLSFQISRLVGFEAIKNG